MTASARKASGITQRPALPRRDQLGTYRKTKTKYVTTAPTSMPASGPRMTSRSTPTVAAITPLRAVGDSACQRDSDSPAPPRECHQSSLMRGLLTTPACGLDEMLAERAG